MPVAAGTDWIEGSKIRKKTDWLDMLAMILNKAAFTFPENTNKHTNNIHFQTPLKLKKKTRNGYQHRNQLQSWSLFKRCTTWNYYFPSPFPIFSEEKETLKALAISLQSRKRIIQGSSVHYPDYLSDSFTCMNFLLPRAMSGHLPRWHLEKWLLL